MNGWVEIEYSITLAALLKRWKNFKISESKIDIQSIEHLIGTQRLIAYDRKDYIASSGYNEWRVHVTQRGGRLRDPLI